VIGNKKKYENVCKIKTYHPIKYYLGIEEECAQCIKNNSKILDLDWNKDEHVFSSMKDYNTHGKPKVDYIESCFQNIVGQPMQSDFGYI
jgi:hypothetical protein